MSRRVGVLVAVVGLALAAGVAGTPHPLAGRAGAAPVPKHLMKAPPYFPTQVGTEWVYTRLGSDETHVVTGVEVKENETLVIVERVMTDGEKKPNKVVSVRPDGLFWVAEGGEAYDPPWCILKHPPEVGHAWETKTARATSSPFTIKRKVVAEERLKVPAGEFQTIRVESESPFAISTTTYWYAPRVGIVQIDDPPHLILKSFTPGKE
jgi:hypothetical protein